MMEGEMDGWREGEMGGGGGGWRGGGVEDEGGGGGEREGRRVEVSVGGLWRREGGGRKW